MPSDVNDDTVQEENIFSLVRETLVDQIRQRSNTMHYVRRRLSLGFPRRQSESTITETQKGELQRAAYSDILTSMSESLDSTSPTKSKHFLMGGIVTSPSVPTKRNTPIPLSMHEDDYKAMLLQRQHQWRASITSHESIPEHPIPHEHVCPYKNGVDICSKCAANKKRQIFLNKLGKLFVTREYDSEEERITVMISQYGNINIPGHKGQKKPDVDIHIKVLFDDCSHRVVKKKLDFCRHTPEFKFNYLSYFDCESHEMSKAAKLIVQLKYKKAFYKRRKVVKTLTMDLKDIEDSPEDTKEYMI